MSLSTIMKRLLNDDYKALYKAGYLDSQLKITDAGRVMLDHITLETNLTKLVDAANKKIEAEEKE